MSGISKSMLLANWCLAWSAFPAITNKAKTRLGTWSPVLSYRFYRMLEYGAQLNILDARIATLSGYSGGVQITPQNISANIVGIQNYLQSISVPQNLSFVMQTTVGIADSAYTMLPLAVASKFEVMGWVLNARKGYDGVTGVNNFRKSMKQNADLALDGYEDMLLLARTV